MTKKRFELRLCSNGTYYVYENGTLTDIDFDKFNKESADALIDEVNTLYEENKQLKSDMRDNYKKYKELLDENEQLKQRNNRQAKQLDNLYTLIEKQDWKTLKGLMQEFQECEEQLQREWETYSDVE